MMDAALAWRTARHSWNRITRRQMMATFLLGVALFAYRFVNTGALGEPFEPVSTAIIFISDQIKVWPLLLAFSVVEHISGRDDDRRMAYAIAALLGTLVAAPLAVTFTSFMFNLLIQPARPRPAFMAYIGLESAMFGAAVLWIIHDRRRSLRARARMHEAELARIAAERRSTESDLQAMQARVEPRFLFNTLAQVRELYEKDAECGERMLDELITYLRAAMPRMRDTYSTAGREAELVRAYLAIVEVRLRHTLDYAIDVAPHARALRMPPMLLLPLVDEAIGCMTAQRAAPRKLSLVIDAGDERMSVRLTAPDPRPSLTPDGMSDAIGERLTALYGSAASITRSNAGQETTETIVQIPVERAPGVVGAAVHSDPDADRYTGADSTLPRSAS
jgi:hypothetical protein